MTTATIIKACKKCGPRPITEFYLRNDHRRKKNGPRSECKACFKERQKFYEVRQ